MISLIRKSNWPQTSICRKIDRHTNALCNMSKNLFLHFEYLTNYILPSHWFIQKLDKVESMNKRWKNTFRWYAAWTWVHCSCSSGTSIANWKKQSSNTVPSGLSFKPASSRPQPSMEAASSYFTNCLLFMVSAAKPFYQHPNWYIVAVLGSTATLIIFIN